MVENLTLYLQFLSPPQSWMRLPTWDPSVSCWFCFDFLVFQSQALCLPSVCELLRNGQEAWLESCPGPHILASLLECQGLDCGAFQKGVLAQKTRRHWLDYCFQSSLGYFGRKCAHWEVGCRGGTRLPENPMERLECPLGGPRAVLGLPHVSSSP